jgi:8-oxo-dGTP pyrophosphatase MutT (NUDIX family)
MRHIAVAVLSLADGKLVLQRRSADAPTSPNGLSFFGGHVEPGESAPAAMRRELSEETSLSSSQSALTYMGDLELSAAKTGRDDVRISVYCCTIASGDFEVYEGMGAEVYSIEELVARDDLGISTRHVINELQKRRGPWH